MVKKIPRHFGQWNPQNPKYNGLKINCKIEENYLNQLVRNSMAIWSMESTKDTYLFEHASGFKKIPWAFFEKMHFEKFKFFVFKKHFEDLRRCKIQFWTTFVFCTKLIFQLPFKL